jgi:hypothetical protein
MLQINDDIYKDDIWDLNEFCLDKVSDDDYEFVNKCGIALKILNELRNKILLNSKQTYQEDNYNLQIGISCLDLYNEPILEVLLLMDLFYELKETGEIIQKIEKMVNHQLQITQLQNLASSKKSKRRRREISSQKF